MNHTDYLPRRRVATRPLWRAAIAPMAALALLLAGLWNLSGHPLMWDEGWTLSTARMWVERGHYGRLMAGELYPLGLEASFPVTGSIALSFRVFGVGIWQGRLVGVLFTVAAVVVLYDLARRVYSREVAIATLAVVLLLPMHRDMHPLTLGRHVLAEMHMMFFLLAGYTCLFLALHRSLWFLPLAVGLWGVALITKAQVMPFWRVSLLVPLFVALPRRQWKTAALLGISLLGASIVADRLRWLVGLVLQGRTLPPPPLRGLVDVVALTPFSPGRPFVLAGALLYGLPAFLGLCYVTWQWLKDLRSGPTAAPHYIVRLALLALAGSWFAWYALLSAGFARYLFPPVFVGSIFAAALLDDLTDHFRFSSVLKRHRSSAGRQGFDRGRPRRVVTLALIAVPLLCTLPFTLILLGRHYSLNTEPALLDTIRFLNTETPPDSLIETYETELHFLLNRRYHYPPDQTHVEILRGRAFEPDVLPPYDPLPADPDYLVIGRQMRHWKLYDSILATNAFRLLRQFGQYSIYERVR